MLGFSIEDLWNGTLSPAVKARADRFRENLSGGENNDGKALVPETVEAETKA